MASLIAGHGHGQTGGVMGVASGAKILPVRVSDAQGRGDSDDVARGIEFAVEHGAEVVNFSGAVAPSQKLIAAVNAASASDVLVVAAAGNKGQDAINAYPAAVSGVLAVGASTRAGRAADFTFPNPNVQICAPGVDIIAADSRGGYVVGEGTSQATALVSGAAALVRAKFPELSAPEVIHRLTATATDIGAPGKDGKCGYGVLNVVKALTVDVPPLSGTTAGAPSTSASPTASPTPAAPEPSASAQTLPVVQRKGANVPAIAGGILAALALVGLLGFLVVRRRKATATQPSRPAP